MMYHGSEHKIIDTQVLYPDFDEDETMLLILLERYFDLPVGSLLYGT